MKLNLYQLCTEDLNVGSIRVVLDDSLRGNVKEAITFLRSKQKLNLISRDLDIDYTTLWDYCNRRSSIPFIVLKKLEKLSNVAFNQVNFQFVCGHQKKPVNLPTKLSENLAKIVGAIIADGHLKIRKSKRGYHYELVIREEYKSNVDAFSHWFEEVFGFKVVPKQIENHYYIYISNKVIVCFLTRVIGLPSGKKVDTISIPTILKNSTNKIKTALLQGIFMFDGGVDHATSYVSLTTRSNNLIEDAHKLLLQIGLAPDYISVHEDNLKRWKILFRKNEKIRRCSVLFEKNTIKHLRLREHFSGPNYEDKVSLQEHLDKTYARTRESSITFTDVIKAVEQLNLANTLEICKKLKKGSTTVQAYLSKLTKWGVLRSKRVGLRKYWELNEKFYIPRR